MSGQPGAPGLRVDRRPAPLQLALRACNATEVGPLSRETRLAELRRLARVQHEPRGAIKEDQAVQERMGQSIAPMHHDCFSA